MTRVGGKCASRGRLVIGTDHVRSTAETAAVYLPETSMHVGKTNDCGDKGSKCAVCENAFGGGGGGDSGGSRSTLRFFGWQIKGRSHRREEGR